jgi:hypothetical protein
MTQGGQSDLRPYMAGLRYADRTSWGAEDSRLPIPGNRHIATGREKSDFGIGEVALQPFAWTWSGDPSGSDLIREPMEIRRTHINRVSIAGSKFIDEVTASVTARMISERNA